MDHAGRVLVTDGIAHLDQLLDQARIGKAVMGGDPANLLLLRERKKLCQQLLRSALGRSPLGEEGAECLLRGGEGLAVIVRRCCLREVLLFTLHRETEETLQAALTPTEVIQPMTARRALGQEVAQDPGIPCGHTRSRGAPQEALEILYGRMVHHKTPLKDLVRDAAAKPEPGQCLLLSIT